MKVWAAVAVVLIGAGWLGYRSAYRAGSEAGAAVVRAEWHADISKREQAATRALRDAQAAYQTDMRRREGVERELDAKLDAATRRGDALARRLRTQACPVSANGGAGSAPVPADGTAGESGDEGAVDAAIAAHLGACERDAERLGELQRWLE